MSHFLSSTQVQQRFGISRSTLYRWQEDPHIAFPRPVKIGHRIMWRDADLAAYESKLTYTK